MQEKNYFLGLGRKMLAKFTAAHRKHYIVRESFSHDNGGNFISSNSHPPTAGKGKGHNG